MATDKSILDLNFQDISRFPLLNRTEESELARKARSGDKAARDKLVVSNLRYVIDVAKQFQWTGEDLKDLISAGTQGLQKAIDKFDPSRGFRLITYADTCIRRSINSGCLRKKRAAPTTLSLNDPVQGKDGEEGTERIDFIEDEHSNPEKDAEYELLKRNLDLVLKALKPREETVLTLHFGLRGYKKMTLEQIGTQLELSKERIRQIENSALDRIRHSNQLIGMLEGYAA